MLSSLQWARSFEDCPTPRNYGTAVAIPCVHCSRRDDAGAEESGCPEEHAEDVLLFGGLVCGVPCNTVHVLAPHSGQWEAVRTTGDLPEPRYLHTACYFQGKVYVFGGERGGRLIYALHELDLGTWRWRRVACSAGVDH
eukprot:RCo041457